jgi:peptidyl-dipeptidase Dcp
MKNKTAKPNKNRLYLVVFVGMAILLVTAAAAQTGKQTMKKVSEDNPFFKPFNTPFQVPPFQQIKVEHYWPAFTEAIRQQKKEIEAIVNSPEPPDFVNTIEALDRSGSLLQKVYLVFSVMKSADSNPQFQEITKKISPLLAGHEDDILLNGGLFKRVKEVYQHKDRWNLSEEQLMALELFYRDFVRGGANLDPQQQTRLRQINQELSVLENRFRTNILGEIDRFQLVIQKKEDLAGLPDWVIAGAAEVAEQRGQAGKWVFTLDKPSWIPFLQFSQRRDLREKIYTAYINQCDHGDELDNKANVSKILSLRSEKAKLLGYSNYAQYMLEPNMAKNPQAVYDLLYKLWKPFLALAKKEAHQLQELIRQEGETFQLKPWDWWYYAEKLKKAKYDIDDNATRPYFKLENVRDGAFYLANKLYGVTFHQRTDIPTYNPEVQVFEVKDADGSHVGLLYMDFFPRSGKQNGAWMNNIREEVTRDGKRIAPVVTNNGNFTRPVGDTPSLLSLEEVETLFHEFGHGLHGLLTRCHYQRTYGDSIPMDFVELPSQIMENWVTEPEMLKIYAKHYKTGEVIPQELVEKIKKAGLFNKGFENVEVLAAALLDMDWHTAENPGKLDVTKFETASLNKIGLIPEIIVRYRTTYFRHIFSGSYAAGYYSYTWAEVLDADAFAAFKETGRLFDRKTATAFRRNVLEKGGTEDPKLLYQRFRGRDPKIDALLERNGLAQE